MTITSPGISTIQVVNNPLTRGTLNMVSLFWLSPQFFSTILFWSVVFLVIELQAHAVTQPQTPTASLMYTKPPLSR